MIIMVIDCKLFQHHCFLDIVFDYHLEDEEKVEEKISLRGWDPVGYHNRFYLNIISGLS